MPVFTQQLLNRGYELTIEANKSSGTTLSFEFYLKFGTYPADLGAPAHIVYTVPAGYRTSSNTVSPAIRVGTFFPGSYIEVVVNGAIYGRGGRGGASGSVSCNPCQSTASSPGEDGGDAIFIEQGPVYIRNNGIIAGGGGGGGGGGTGANGPAYPSYGYVSGTGGCGQSHGSVFSGTVGVWGGCNFPRIGTRGEGTNQFLNRGGNGGLGGSDSTPPPGGVGGAPGVAGTNGTNADDWPPRAYESGGGGGGGGWGANGGSGGDCFQPFSGNLCTYEPPASGGAGGKAVESSGQSVIWLATGTRYGATS